MSHRMCCLALLAVAASFFGPVNPSRAQSQDAVVAAHSYAAVSIKPDKSGLQERTIHLDPGELKVTNETLQMLIRHAYQVEADQIHGGPDWLNSERFDIRAKVDKSVVENLQSLAPEQADLEQRRMMQVFLADRFKLAAHRDTRSVPTYDLVLAENGPRLQASMPGDAAQRRVIEVANGHITGREVPIATLASLLSDQLGHTVVDETGLTSHYDVTLQWPASADGQQGSDVSSESSNAAIASALEEQLGLKLEPRQAPVEILVIDHVEKPSTPASL
jgi:uncharacterized protein (TIGR03435 family)